jgi:hypothetical protein
MIRQATDMGDHAPDPAKKPKPKPDPKPTLESTRTRWIGVDQREDLEKEIKAHKQRQKRIADDEALAMEAIRLAQPERMSSRGEFVRYRLLYAALQELITPSDDSSVTQYSPDVWRFYLNDIHILLSKFIKNLNNYDTQTQRAFSTTPMYRPPTRLPDPGGTFINPDNADTVPAYDIVCRNVLHDVYENAHRISTYGTEWTHLLSVHYLSANRADVDRFVTTCHPGLSQQDLKFVQLKRAIAEAVEMCNALTALRKAHHGQHPGEPQLDTRAYAPRTLLEALVEQGDSQDAQPPRPPADAPGDQSQLVNLLVQRVRSLVAVVNAL